MENYKGNESFADYCQALLGEYADVAPLVRDSTDMFFSSSGLLKNPTLQVRRSFNGKIFIGKFYLIRYNYNGNKLWCPIFVIDDRYNAEMQKRIIYAINFDYLPYRYKIAYLDKLFRMFKDVIQKNKKRNDDGEDVNKEIPFKVNFESIYRTLKDNGGFNFAITGFDYSKIVGMEKGQPEVYGVSTSIIPRFVFIDTKIVNQRIMMQAIKDTDIEKEKEKLSEILGLYEKLMKDYEKDVKEYYQKLKLIESHYKLAENI